MKRFLFFILLFLFAVSSQGSVTVTIGTGTSITTGTNSSITPYKTYWMDGQDQILFSAAELSAAGLSEGNIQKLAFNVGGTPSSATLNSYTISMQQIAGTSLSGFLTSGWTVCYTGNVVPVTGWNTYTFTTPFHWDGVSSLVFKVCYNNTSYTSNTHVYYTDTPSTGVHLSWFNDLPNSSGCDEISAPYNLQRPNVQITAEPSNPCTGTPNPGNTISSSYSLCPNISFTLSLQNPTPGSGVTYLWQTSSSGGDPWTNTGASSSTYVTSQTASTYYRCQVTCSGNAGASNPVLVAIGAPVPGNTISSANPICAGVNFTLSLQYPTVGVDTYQWQASVTGGDPWTNTGTNSPTFTTSLTASTYYHCLVTCGSNTGISSAIQVVVNSVFSCYCPSKPNDPRDEEIFSVTISGNTNAYSCTTTAPGPGSILNIYSNFFPLGSLFNLPQSIVVPFTIQEDECDGPPYYPNGCAIWIDYNKDGDFTDAGEQAYSEVSPSMSPRIITGSIAVPADAPLGVTAMRITVAESYSGTSLTPCLLYQFGETEDYKITITQAITCPQPYNLTATAITTNSANLSWTAGNAETFWEYVYGVSPLSEPSSPGISTSSNTVNPLTGLSPNTTYQYYVRAVCGSDFSLWTGPSTFKTFCEAVTPPVSENFDMVTPAGAMPDCWSKKISTALSSAVVDITYSGLSHSFPYQARLYNLNYLSGNILLITPEMSLPLNNLSLKFWALGGAGYTLGIGTMTDPSDEATYTQLASISPTATYAEYVVSFSAYSGTDAYIAFKHGMGGNYRFIYIDDVQIYSPSSLRGFVYDYDGTPVSGATITRVGGNSATSGPGGDYLLSPLIFGTQQFKCSKAGYNDVIITIDIPDGTAVIQNFTLPNPQMEINPPSLYEVLLPMQMSTIDLSVINDGSGNLGWQSGILYQGGSCQYTIKLWDTYGDGWNGCKLDVLVNGIVVLDDITLNSGFGPAIFNFTINGTGQITTAFSAAMYPAEPSYYIYNLSGTQVWYSPPGNNSGPVNILPGQLSGSCEDWLSIDFNGNVFPFGGRDTVSVHFDPTKAGTSGGSPGETYTADIVFTSSPDAGTVTIPVTLEIADETLEPATDLAIFIVNPKQGKLKLTWNFNPSRTSSYFIVLRNGQLIGTSHDKIYLDDLDDPGHYCYKVCCVYPDGSVSVPTETMCLDFPFAPEVPLSNWAIILGAVLILTFAFIYYKRIV